MSGEPEEAELLAGLRDGLRDGTLLANGRVLPERQLAERMGVGRTRLRRLLDVIEAEGGIFRRQGQGTFAAPPPAAGAVRTLARQVTPQNVMEVRLEVEPALAALAAQRASAEELQLLRRLMGATLRAQDVRSYETADDIFHFKIAELAHNPLFLTIHQSIRSVRRHAQWTSRRRATMTPERLAELGRQHEELVTHISERRSAAAAGAMERHLITVSNAMLRERKIWSGEGPVPQEASSQRTDTRRGAPSDTLRPKT
ncbi:FadR/GntR family transcriptional regulator [Profundibacterium mesophilum]|uniref:V-type H+-transporting ATPase subunit E n=1 Tax=Profundibacterium mesophilum KAUST100406-0324 TaxID=1037889 RepID=A0A921NPI8_9RHOB|nr:FCD domain-containing protein [Profundibacterium mesophilum]KAF0676071.1 V-type H+-transporting ATPase subunit E [Profundibacterium mesophilum KAUST100406-0324]